jgi:transcriptional regulator with XRE-family HTH domain
MAEPPSVHRTYPMSDAQNRPAAQLAGRAANREVAGRLHEAVRAAGGNLAVARRAGVPLGTLSNYVRGRNGMKIEPLSALAVACNVSLDWLVSGTEASPTGLLIGADFPVAADAPPPGLGEAPASPPLAGMSGGIDARVLAKAIEVVAAIAGAAEFQQDPKGLARRIAATYAVLIEPDVSRE